MSESSVVRLLRDARRGLTVTRRLAKASHRRPWGEESSSWRNWAFPLYILPFAVATLLSAAQGYTPWLTAIPISLGITLVSILLLARLARRVERDYPDA